MKRNYIWAITGAGEDLVKKSFLDLSTSLGIESFYFNHHNPKKYDDSFFSSNKITTVPLDYISTFLSTFSSNGKVLILLDEGNKDFVSSKNIDTVPYYFDYDKILTIAKHFISLANRPTKLELFSKFAWDLRNLATCIRAKHACIITTENFDNIMSIGYNGKAPGEQHICDGPFDHGNCGCLHAEENAMNKCLDFRRKSMILTGEPCSKCARGIVLHPGPISCVYYVSGGYRSSSGLAILKNSGINTVDIRDILFDE